MGNEFNRGAQAIKRLNPLRVANTFHFLLGCIFLLGGLLVLLMSKSTIQGEAAPVAAMVQVSTAIFMMLIGGLHITLAMTFWGFRFAPSEVSMLGPEGGDRRKAEAYLREVINKGIAPAQGFPGAIGGFLEAVVPKLAFAPPSIQRHAYIQALRGLYVAVVLAGFLLAWLMADAAVFPWMALIYFLMAVAAVKPQETLSLIRSGRADTESAKDVPLPTLKGAIALIVLSILGPVLLGMAGRVGLPPAPFEASVTTIPTLAILLPALLGSALFFWALTKQTEGLTSSEVRHFDAPDFSVPDLTSGLIDRLAQQIPDPKAQYAHSVNVAQGSQGAMEASFLFETEPVLVESSGASTLMEGLFDAWKSPVYRPLLVLEFLGLVLGLASCMLIYLFASRQGASSLGLTAAGLLASSQFCMISAHKLWRRAEFRSKVYSVYYKVNFTQVERELGNVVRGGGVLRDSAPRIVAGRLLCCVADVQSVCFQRNGQRFVTTVDLDTAKTQFLVNEAAAYHRDALARSRGFDQEESARQRVLSTQPQLTVEELGHVVQAEE